MATVLFGCVHTAGRSGLAKSDFFFFSHNSANKSDLFTSDLGHFYTRSWVGQIRALLGKSTRMLYSESDILLSVSFTDYKIVVYRSCTLHRSYVVACHVSCKSFTLFLFQRCEDTLLATCTYWKIATLVPMFCSDSNDEYPAHNYVSV